MSVFKDDQTTYTGNVTVLGSLNVGVNLVVTGGITVGGNPVVAATPITNSLGSDTAISNTIYTDGPSVAQGSTGTWFAAGTVTFQDSAGSFQVSAKLWDGTTVISSGRQQVAVATANGTISLSGYLAAPAGNIRISCTSNAAGATSTFKFNASGNSKDCTISALRVA